jgi:hypothetical protein
MPRRRARLGGLWNRAAGGGALLPPVLFAVFPALSLFAQNETDIELGVLWWPIAICVGTAVGLFALFLLMTRRADKAGGLATFAVVWFFYFGVFFENAGLGLRPGWFFVLWTALLLAAAAALLRTRRSLAPLTAIALVASAALTVPAIVRVATYQSNHPGLSASDPRLWPTALRPPPRRAGALPDIYLIVPDDYARPDVLRRFFHYGDAAFLGALRARGFIVSPQSRSPYSDSESNTAAEVNMDYLSRFPKILGARSQDVRPVKRVEEDNRAARLLAPLGYRYAHLDTDEVTFAGGNPRISSTSPPDSYANLWLHKSVLRLLGGPLGFDQSGMNARFRSSVRSQFAALEAEARRPGPKFVLFHTLLPHDPYVFGAGGRAVTFPGTTDESLGNRLGMRYYLAQLEYLNGRLLAAVDAILEHQRRPAVIVIQADEGFQGDPGTFGDATANDIRVKGLLALRLPGARGARPPQPPTTVNTLRYVFNRYLGTRYPMLPSASYPEGDFPYQWEAMRVR